MKIAMLDGPERHLNRRHVFIPFAGDLTHGVEDFSWLGSNCIGPSAEQFEPMCHAAQSLARVVDAMQMVWPKTEDLGEIWQMLSAILARVAILNREEMEQIVRRSSRVCLRAFLEQAQKRLARHERLRVVKDSVLGQRMNTLVRKVHMSGELIKLEPMLFRPLYFVLEGFPTHGNLDQELNPMPAFAPAEGDQMGA